MPLLASSLFPPIMKSSCLWATDWILKAVPCQIDNGSFSELPVVMDSQPFLQVSPGPYALFGERTFSWQKRQ